MIRAREGSSVGFGARAAARNPAELRAVAAEGANGMGRPLVALARFACWRRVCALEATFITSLSASSPCSGARGLGIQQQRGGRALGPASLRLEAPKLRVRPPDSAGGPS